MRIRPRKIVMHDFGGPVNAVRLESGNGIGQLFSVRKPIEISRAGGLRLDNHPMKTQLLGVHRDEKVVRSEEVEIHLFGERRPHAESASVVIEPDGSNVFHGYSPSGREMGSKSEKQSDQFSIRQFSILIRGDMLTFSFPRMRIENWRI